MSHVRVFETSINLSAIETFTDLDKTIIQKIRDVYAGKCYGGAFLSKVIEVVRRSKCRPSQNLEDGSSRVDVQFSAECISYKRGDLIANCKVFKNINKSGLVCVVPNANVMMRGNYLLRPIREGQIVPAIVNDVRYPVKKEEMTISANPYSHNTKPVIYRIVDDELGENSPVIASLRGQLLATMHRHKSAPKAVQDRIKYFSELFYPFKKKKALPKCTVMTIEDLTKEMKHPGDVLIIRHDSAPRLDGKLFIMPANSFKEDPKNPIVPEIYSNVLIRFLEDQIDYCSFILELAEMFQDKKKFDANKEVWKMYNDIKR